MLLVEYRVNCADLNAESVSISATLFFFKAVQSFQAKAKPFPDLPYKVHTCVVRQMISIRLL